MGVMLLYMRTCFSQFCTHTVFSTLSPTYRHDIWAPLLSPSVSHAPQLILAFATQHGDYGAGFLKMLQIIRDEGLYTPRMVCQEG